MIRDHTVPNDLGSLEANGDLGPGDHPQVRPCPPRPPANVRVRGQDAAPHPVVLWPGLKNKIIISGED